MIEPQILVGLRDPGRPGDIRYLCPWCSWYHDFGPIDSSKVIEDRLKLHVEAVHRELAP